ncbi:MAG: cobyrinate a,c-diamide synthase [Candidatus Rokubacteria bacterium]|nr:cobyrinate a,c-diamide synthase [Candidatus Rokubacteria bacterium]
MTRMLVVAGVASGVGKTTVTLGLLEAYRRRGLRVQAFKVGPDFIDPGFHQLVTGRPSYNLDGWMCGREHVLATVARQAADADLALIEGVMGCFDGADPTGDDGSTAQVAKWLGAPVVLVFDAASQARSAAAVVQGFERFDPELAVAAVIANRVGGAAHAQLIREAVRAYCRALPVGAVARDDRLALPERHLGLVTAVEGTLAPERLRQLGDAIEASVDLDQLLALAAPLRLGTGATPFAQNDIRTGMAPVPTAAPRGRDQRVRIGVARDAAFQFYYAENLELLRAAGAELTFWSPLGDGLPEVDGLYFGGGYPELHARQLADNARALKAVGEFAAAGRPIYAECGGLMYLAETLEDLEGVPHRMVGVLPTTVRLLPRRMTLGYTEVRVAADTPLGPAGVVARGHEFHFSTIDPVPASVPRVYRLQGRPGVERTEGYLCGRALLSYVHLHFGSNPALAANFVAACAARGR